MSGRTLQELRTALPQARRYLIVIAICNLLWEALQLPLYGIWTKAKAGEIAFDVLHCTLGDVLIAAASLAVAMILVGSVELTRKPVLVATIAIPAGLIYTIFSEWLNVSVRGNWSYAPEMPLLPGSDIGLTPLLQWAIVPTLTFAVITITARAHSKSESSAEGDVHAPVNVGDCRSAPTGRETD